MEPKSPLPTPPAPKHTVLLVDDHPIVLEGLAKRINSEEDLVVCGQARTPAEALAAIQRGQPEVVVVDLAFKEGHGLELIKDIRAQANPVPILVFTMYEDPVYAVRAVRAGAQGFVTKQESSDRLVVGLRELIHGGYALDGQLTKLVRYTMPGTSDATAEVTTLGDRELEVFELLGTGLGTREIAHRLGRSIKTVETYRARIKRKLHLKTATELVREAVKWVEKRRSN